MAEQVESVEQTLAAFIFENGEASRRFLKTVEKIDEMDHNVRIVDAAIADRTKLGRVKVHQTTDRGAVKGGVRGGTIGVVVGTILLGPAGAVVGGAAGGVLAGLHNRFHDIGVDDKFMREVAQQMAKGGSALFVLYEGSWSASIGLIEDAVKTEGAYLIDSTLPATTAAALQQLIAPAIEELGGEDVVADYEVDTEAGAEAAGQQRRPAPTKPTTSPRILGVEPESADGPAGGGESPPTRASRPRANPTFVASSGTPAAPSRRTSTRGPCRHRSPPMATGPGSRPSWRRASPNRSSRPRRRRPSPMT